jgi:hypothetical protein
MPTGSNSDHTMNASALWKMDGTTARTRLPRFSGQVQCTHPQDGLHAIQCDGQALAAHAWLAIELPGERPTAAEVEAYVRGSDLIVTYAETATRPLRAQAYWRMIEPGSKGLLAAIELVASVQTNLLDACPRITARSLVAGGELLSIGEFPRKSEEVGGRGFLIRPAGATFSYAEMIAGGAGHDDRVETAASRIRLEHDLFADWLEKGVILRTRIRGVLLERAGDLAAATDQFNEFLATALPLTV